jgi:hypothetical protein
MTGMNRLSPWIVRRPRPSLAIAVAAPAPLPAFADDAPLAQWLDDLRLFATGWVGGLIFFSTLLG